MDLEVNNLNLPVVNMKLELVEVESDGNIET